MSASEMPASPAKVALALSPHLDDAAFSCGGTLRRLAASGWRVVVATLFTATRPEPRGFALACQLDKGLGPEVDYMALRRAEDVDALHRLGAEPVHLPFAEAPHRGYDSPAALFAGPRPDDAGIVPALGRTVAGLLDDVAPALVLAPQAIGGHVDHVQLVRAIDDARGRAGASPRAPALAPVLWWRDYPYTVRPDTPRAPFAGRFGARPLFDVVLGPEAETAKRDACAAYASQLGYQFGGAARLRDLLAAERGRELFAVEGVLPEALRALAPAEIAP